MRKSSSRTKASKRSRLIPAKSGYFTAIGSSTVKTVADRHDMLHIITNTGDELLKVLTSMILNDLKSPK